MVERSSRPHHSPRQTPQPVERRICRLRERRWWGASRDRCHWCGRLLMEWGANSRLRGFGRGGASYRLLDQVRPL